ncbi:MAG TPA: DNA starvation/stationary phase protection protein [Prolixibacteraceae bacterium]|nr:DNA starvation/stationary phase protection protein [Prolixibacteraceae bacterium]
MQKYAESPNFADDVVVTFLNLLLADEYVLYTKTRTAHWNVDGENYFETHLFLENQYNVLDLIIDDLAEQIRSLGHFALGSLKDFLSISQMSDDNQDFVHSGRIFETLLIDHENIIHTIQREIFPISNRFNDLNTAGFLTELVMQHIQMVLRLKGFINESVYTETIPIQANTR